MSQAAIEDAPSNERVPLSEHLAAAIPSNLETMLFEYIAGEKLVSHGNEGQNKHEDVDSYTAAAVIRLVRNQSVVAQKELVTNQGIGLSVIPRGMALHGLVRFYDQIHEAPAQASSLYEEHVESLRRQGLRFMDVHVAHTLAQQLRAPRDITMFEDEQRDFLVGKVLPETFAAQSLAIQTLRHDPIHKLRPRATDEMFG